MRSKFIALLSGVLLIMLISTACAAIPGDVSEGKYIKTFVRGTQNVPAYRDSSLHTRGNSRGAYNAAVYPTDEIRIYQMNGSVAYIGYIAGKNWVKAYIATSAITPNNSSVDGQRFSSGIGRGNVFARPNGTVYSGSAIDAGDTVWKLAEENGYTQVVYPAGNLYKMAWIRTGDYNSRVSNGGRVVPTPAPNPVVQPVSRPAADTYVSPAEGDYYLLPEANSGFAMDVKNGGAAPIQTIIHLWNKNDSDAQIFHIKRVNGNWHIIQHKRTGYVVNVQWGSNASGTGVWLYHNDGTASCYWRFIKHDNGSYMIQSQLPGNPILELQNNSVYAGGRIQLWQRHSTQAGRWKLVPVGNVSPVTQKRKALRTVDAYALSSLQNRIGRVDAGDMVTVLEEYGNAYRLEYPTPKGSKYGWVTKEIFSGGNIDDSFDPIWPLVNSHTITTLYRYSSGGRHSTRYRYGIDMSAPEGENVIATETGTVIASFYDTKTGFGNIIKIKHDNGKVSLYAHLSARLVSGGRVSKGQVIGRVGHTSAKYKIGNHLHFELGNSDSSGADGDPWREYFKPKYGNTIKLTQAAAKYPNP